MEMQVVIAGKIYQVDLQRPKSLAIPLNFDGPQPEFFGAPRAAAAPLRADGFVGDTLHGGSCNVSQLSLVPHCNGTHTESVGHVLHDAPVGLESLGQDLVPAAVISVTPEAAADGDRVIARDALAAALSGRDMDELAALVVRTLPNPPSKKFTRYGDGNAPPYFSAEAMTWIASRNIQHLIVDIPSIDKMRDDGRLANHRKFWNLPEGARTATRDTHGHKTVTEMAFVDDDTADGLYLLNLQFPAFHSDAAPSRPIVYALR